MSGLSVSEADDHLKKYGGNSIMSSKRKSKLMLSDDKIIGSINISASASGKRIYSAFIENAEALLHFLFFRLQ